MGEHWCAVEDARLLGDKMKLADHSNCTGCALCVAVCELNAIKIIEDKNEHFFYPEIIKGKCLECGQCLEVCPGAKIAANCSRPICAYAANNKSSEIRMISASGGMFRALASQVVSEGGAVAGVEYDGVDRCQHTVVTSEKDLDSLCGTKYFQSETNGVFADLEVHASRHGALMFCGTPCQVAAMKCYATLKGFDRKLIIVEILCRGISPAFLHKCFLQHLENKFRKKVISIHYKEKSKGWDQIGTMVRFEDDSEEYIDRSENYLARLAYELNLSIRECCYNCKFKKVERCADITIGDFWGLKDSPLLDNLGTSFIMINTQKGMDLFDKVADKLELYPCSVDAVVSGNRYGFDQVQCDHKMRDYLWDGLNNGEDVGVVTERIINKALDAKIKRQKRMIDKDNRIMKLYERWVTGYSRGENMCQFLLDNRLEHIAIFGFGTLGRAVFDVIRSSSVSVSYIIESNKSRWDKNLCQFFTAQDDLPNVDAVIVTAISDFEDISKKMKENLICPILSLEDIVP